MQVDEFCLFLKYDNDQLIREIAEMFKEDIGEGNAEEMDDSTEIASSALKSLENVLISLCYANNYFRLRNF